MLDFLPYFQIVIGLYISFCFEKLIQSLLWSEDFTKGLTSFYHDWSTLAWHKEKNDEDKLLQERIEQSIRGYVSRTKKIGMFMLISVSTMLLSYCWSGHHTVRNDQFMLAYSIWNICFFVLVFCRRVWTNWWYVILAYILLLGITIVEMFLFAKYNIIISHRTKVALAILCISGMTFPLVTELFRARIRSDFFLKYLTSCRDKFSKRCAYLLFAIVNGEYKESKYLLQLKDNNISKFNDGDKFDKSKLLGTLMSAILNASEKQALKILTEDNRTLKILFYNRFSKHYQPVALNELNTEDDLFKLIFSWACN